MHDSAVRAGGAWGQGESEGVSTLCALYRQHCLHLVRLAVPLVGDQRRAEELVVRVFAGLYENGQNLDRLADPRRYLTSAVVDEARMPRGRRLASWSRREHPAAASTPLSDPTSEAIWAAISRLPTRQRQVIVLRYYQRWSVPEIAAALGLLRDVASSRLDRGVASLASRLGPAMPSQAELITKALRDRADTVTGANLRNPDFPAHRISRRRRGR